ncbi:M13-type metalloendopeptidase [Dokdonella sp.]|uniref:M13 family metallopeptidase n=1 Tax=Dokdonella sp. TaxID=2291710 RepID=UPI0025C3B5CF|nr:M13-type metalloendopeptidase [Dokdonella sp.]MBX3692452.1 peptidase [Dokdonella sp.]
MNPTPLKPLALALATTLTLAACKQADQPTTAAAAPAASTAPVQKHVAFDISELDTTIDACQDFNGFVNAKWLAANPVPADKTRWGSFDMLREKSLNTQKALVEAVAAKTDAAPGSLEQLVGAFYAAAMDEAAIERAGFDPIKSELAKIDALQGPGDVAAYLTAAHAQGFMQVFAFGSGADYKDSANTIAYAFQAGLTLPTRDYYTDDKHAATREAYTAHIVRLLELVGVDAAAAKQQAADVLAFETRLAKVSFAPAELNDPANQYNFVSLDEAKKAMPHFDWPAFFAAQGANVEKGFSLSQPKFFAEVDRMIAETPIAQWQAYLRFHAVDAAAPYLSSPFQDASFAFHKQTLNGQKEQEPRWKRALASVNDNIGMALGQLYVVDNFPPEAKERARVLVDNVQAALKARIEKLDWMGEATKAKALEKWASFLPKIGYPDKWRDWSGLELKRDDHFGNILATLKFNHAHDVAKIGKPTDRLEWHMTPQTVNAYYNPTDNTINFPAAILQPPFFDAQADDAINYGGIGAVIGHEAIHGYDDQGSQFDARGNYADWWQPADKEAFKARTGKLVEQFAAYEPLPGKHIDGVLTLGENIADLGGLTVSYDALQVALGKKPGESNATIDGYTEDQRFFLNWARVWRGNMLDKRLEVMLATDPHSPARYRATGAPSNLDSFASAFGCKEGDAMVRSGDAQVKIW